jgi:NTE family protein
MLFLLMSEGVSASSAADAPEADEPQRPKIGLVLGGGGAKGAAHIGVLKVLEEQKIPVDYIAGTSMGAIVGALYASGLSAEELEKVLTSIDWKDVLSGESERRDIDYRRKREDYEILSGLSLGIKDGKIVMPRGLVKDQKVNVLFETLMLHTSDIDDFDKLPIPYRAVAADLETGEMVVLKSGSLADAARASMSVPGAFPPIELNGRILIDGGIVRNLPVDIVRDMGADIIICVDVGKPLNTRKDLGSPVSIMSQMLDIMMKKNVEAQIKNLGPQDVYINPQLGELGSTDFDKAAEIARIGEKAASEKVSALRRYSVTDAEYASFTARHHRELVKAVKIASVKIEVEGEKRIPSEIVADRLSVRPGDTVDLEKLKEEAGIVYGTGDFERVDLNVKKQAEGYELIVKAKEKSWGPNYLRFGVALESDVEGSSGYNILLDYTRRWINSRGAEWKTQVNLGWLTGIYSEFYQPLTVSRLFFISPHARWKRQLYDVFVGRHREASYSVTSYEGGVDFGYQPWMYGEARLGLRFGKFKAASKVGEVDLPEDHAMRGALVAGGRLDQLDNVNFPNKGYLAQVKFLSSLKALGSDDEYNKIEGSALGVFTFRKQTVLASLSAGTHVGNDLPFYDQFNLGGFLDLSGLRSNQLLGQSMAIAKLITYRRVGRSFIGDLYLGGSLEAGNVWKQDEKQFDLGNLRLAGSLFVGYDTITGPLYLAFGHADGGYNAGYFYLGRTF